MSSSAPSARHNSAQSDDPVPVRGCHVTVLYVSNSNPPTDIDRDGEIYRMRLDGTITGKFGRVGKLLKEFGTVNAIDCSNENTLYVCEIGNLRVQKLMLH